MEKRRRLGSQGSAEKPFMKLSLPSIGRRGQRKKGAKRLSVESNW